ncbi:MAG: hypothetical protein HPY55_03385 [Firmicutes bacterium]|nr:hypothetical protein [Bacillota bacterium]
MSKRVAAGALAAFAVVLALAAVAATLGWGSGFAGAGAAAEPGSPDDPLISKGYFDRHVMLTVVNLPAGGKITCEAGAEVVLRAGKATAVGSPQGGLSDVTAGKDIQTGQPVSLNHLLIIPRSDGRGLQATTDCVLMVRGPYTTTP